MAFLKTLRKWISWIRSWQVRLPETLEEKDRREEEEEEARVFARKSERMRWATWRWAMLPHAPGCKCLVCSAK